MAELLIQTFNGEYIAIFRPKKKTYSILTFNTANRLWRPVYMIIQPDTVTLNDIQTPTVKVMIEYKTGKLVSCKAYGEYLHWIRGEVTYAVPILHKYNSPDSFPPSFHQNEFVCTTNSALPPVNDLWVLRPPPVPVVELEVVQPPVTIRARMPKPIPQRIAWIIAEDASKKVETCPITLESISPLTAAVTSCYHVFDANAIAVWFETNSECPMCKTKCVTTVCFTE